eukprot:Tbor_TRINITY_DN5810_c4_g4::TRINITY_DN5810_c4_g4_i1::g.6304::m.6304
MEVQSYKKQSPIDVTLCIPSKDTAIIEVHRNKKLSPMQVTLLSPSRYKCCIAQENKKLLPMLTTSSAPTNQTDDASTPARNPSPITISPLSFLVTHPGISPSSAITLGLTIRALRRHWGFIRL